MAKEKKKHEAIKLRPTFVFKFNFETYLEVQKLTSVIPNGKLPQYNRLACIVICAPCGRAVAGITPPDNGVGISTCPEAKC